MRDPNYGRWKAVLTERFESAESIRLAEDARKEKKWEEFRLKAQAEQAANQAKEANEAKERRPGHSPMQLTCARCCGRKGDAREPLQPAPAAGTLG